MANVPSDRRLALLAGCAVVALALPLAPGAIDPAQAASCGLSLNDSDATIDTVGGADSGELVARTACGFGATATGAFATAVGTVAKATATSSAAFGNAAEATGALSTAVGTSAGSSSGTASGYTVLGGFAGVQHTLGAFSTTIGGSDSFGINNPRATGDFSIAIGGGSAANTAGAIAGGANGNDFTIAIGTRAQAGAGASGRTGAVAVGHNARANAVGAVAFGHSSSASGNNSVALGRQSVASARASVAIGQGSVANRVNTVSVGSANLKRRIMNVAPGTAANDAVTVAQLNAAVASVAAGATSAAVAVPAAPEPPAVSVVRVGDAGHTIEDMRREFSELRALVRQQLQRIAQLESRIAAAAK